MLVTIVIPTYKRQDRIVRAVDCALKQTVKEKEIIVVDDNGKGTKDQLETEQALQSYIQNNEIIYLINDKNSGGSFSRNQGLNIAKGEFITFLDDDDEIDPHKLEKQIQCLKEKGNEYSCCYTSFHKLLKNNKLYKNKEHIQGDVYVYALARSIYLGSGSNLLVRTSVAREIGGYDISFKRNQDLEFFARCVKNYKLAYVDEDLMTIHYEIREFKRSYQDMIAVDDFYLSKFKNEIEQLSSQEQKAIYQTVALERFRYSIPRHELKDSIHNLKENQVSFFLFMKYIFYVLKRVICKESYGFKIVK